jgi:hypothetical protein
MAIEGHMELASRIDRRIAMEASFLSNLSTTVREAIPSMMASINGALSSIKFFSNDKTAVNGSTVFLNLLEKSNFVEISDVKIFTPEGLVGNLPAYTDVLKSCSEHASKVVTDVLVPYNTFLAQLLSSNSARLSSFGQLNYMLKKDEQREKLNELIGSFIVPGSTQVKQPVGKAFNRNSEWRDMLANQSESTQAINSVGIKSVMSAMDECVQLIDAIRTASSSGELDSLSGPMLRQLSTTTLTAANEVTFYSITAYRVNVLTKAINDSIDVLTKELKK